jgi:transcriptional regulator with XRE-family HTH domain
MDARNAIRASLDLRYALKSRIIVGMAAYDEIVARNTRAFRTRNGIGQERLAARMRALGFTAWLRQTVSKTEQGERRLTAAEINGLAWALEVSIAELVQPIPSDKLVEFPGGSALAAKSVADSVRGTNDGSVTWKGDSPEFTAASWPAAAYEAWQSAQDGED